MKKLIFSLFICLSFFGTRQGVAQVDCSQILPYIKEYYGFEDFESFARTTAYHLKTDNYSITKSERSASNSTEINLLLKKLKGGYGGSKNSSDKRYQELINALEKSDLNTVSYSTQKWFMQEIGNVDIANIWLNCVELQANNLNITCQIRLKGTDRFVFTVTNNDYKVQTISQILDSQFGNLEAVLPRVLNNGTEIPVGTPITQVYRILNPEKKSEVQINFNNVPKVFEYTVTPDLEEPEVDLTGTFNREWRLISCSTIQAKKLDSGSKLDHSGFTPQPNDIGFTTHTDNGVKVESDLVAPSCPLTTPYRVTYNNEMVDYILSIEPSQLKGRFVAKISISEEQKQELDEVNRVQMPKLDYTMTNISTNEKHVVVAGQPQKWTLNDESLTIESTTHRLTFIPIHE